MKDINLGGTGDRSQAQVDDLETLIPLGDQVLIRPDKPKKTTRGGIILPGNMAIPVMRGRVLAVSYFVHMGYVSADAPDMHRVNEGDRVVFHWDGALPQDIENEQSNVLVSINNILGKIKPEKKNDSVRHPEPAGIV